MSSLFSVASATVGGGHQARSGGYKMQRSVRLRSAASAYFSRNAYPVASAGTQWTMSAWIKRGSFSAGDLFSFVGTTGSAQQAGIQFDSNAAIRWWQYAPSAYQFHKVTTAVFRDPSAWYHLVFVYNTTLATAGDRLQIWVNGIRQTSFSTNVDPSQNLVTYYKTGQYYPHIGGENRDGSSVSTPFDGYISELHFIDGQALTPSDFGQTDPYTGVWSARRYAGTYGTNGFYLNFSDNSAATAAAIGKDYSGNGNNWTPNNISVTAGATYDSMLDVPTRWADGGNGRGNYAVLNPLYIYNANGTLSGANLDFTGGNVAWVRQATIAIRDKSYCEVTVNTKGANDAQECGLSTIGNQDFIVEWNWSIAGNRLTVNGSLSGTSMPQVVAGDVIGIAVDPAAKSCSLYRNNTLAATVTYTATNDVTFYVGNTFTNGSWSGSINFGQRPFAYTPPSGFKTLNTQNLP